MNVWASYDEGRGHLQEALSCDKTKKLPLKLLTHWLLTSMVMSLFDQLLLNVTGRQAKLI